MGRAIGADVGPGPVIGGRLDGDEERLDAMSDLYEDYARLARKVQEAHRELDEVRATADSDDGLVTATVGGRGELLELTLDPRAYRDTDTLAVTIRNTITDAAEAARRRAFEINRPFLHRDADPDRVDVTFDPFLHQLTRQLNGDRA
jgi:DNA-binding protein YbaB